MFGNREVHRKLSGTGGYAAGRLAEISESLGQLAKVMKNSGEDPGLSREDGIAALESAASMVCGSCDRCGMKQECLEDQDGENYFLYYLLRSFEKKGALEYPDMPREFLDRCRKKTDYLRELNRSLGRSTMNLAWKNRFLESRDAVMLQFEEMAGILGEFSGQMEQAADVTEALVPAVRAAFRKRRIALEDMLVLKYGDGRREAFLTARTGNGRCVTVKDMAALYGQAVGAEFIPARNGKTLVTRKSSMVRLIEKGSYRILFGCAKTPKEGEEVSGDNYMFRNTLPGQVALSLSDGMGSGPAAGADSEQVMELAEQLLDTGFSARSTLKLINTVLLLNGMGDRPATMDLGLVNLYTGVLEMMKLGAAASFLLPDRRGGGEAEVLESETVPAGVLNPVEPVMISRKLWDGDKIIMVSDGVLDAMPGVEKEKAFREFLDGLPDAGVQETAEMILTFALSFEGEPRDDMTVLVGGIYG